MTTSFETKLSDESGKLKNKNVVLALSGGKDSASLLHYLSVHSERLGLNILAVHVNHKIRGVQADSDELFCTEFCEKLGVKVKCVSADIPLYAKIKGMSIEHAARIVRYRILNEAAKNMPADLILTAHTKNDQIETFFIRLLQGGSIYSLSGIEKECGRMFRPMLEVTTEEVEEYRSVYKVACIQDESNTDINFLRNKIRAGVIEELLKFETGNIDNIISIMNDSGDLKSEMEKRLADFLRCENDFWECKKEKFLKLSEPDKSFIFHKIMTPLFRVERRHLSEVYRLLKSNESKRIDLPDGFVFESSINCLRIFKKSLLADFEIVKKEEEDKVYIKHLDKEIIFSDELKDKKLFIRNRRAGDRLNKRKLKDILIDRKIDIFDRDRLIVIEDEKTILWVENISSSDNISILENCNFG